MALVEPTQTSRIANISAGVICMFVVSFIGILGALNIMKNKRMNSLLVVMFYLGVLSANVYNISIISRHSILFRVWSG